MIEHPASGNSFWVMHCIYYEPVFNLRIEVELQFKLVQWVGMAGKLHKELDFCDKYTMQQRITQGTLQN